MRNLILFAGVACLLAGCSGGGGSVVTGKVTLDDGSAAPRGSVMLINESDRFQGVIGSDGTYTIEGVAAGDYGVAVIGVMDRELDDPDDGMAYDDDTGEYAAPSADAPVSLIQAKYSNPQQSGLTLSVPGENYDLTVEAVGGSR